MIFREEGSATRLVMEQFFDRDNINVRKKIELISNEVVKQAVIAGLGYSIMQLIGMRNEILNNEMYIIPAEGFPITCNWRLIWLKGKKSSPLATAF